jgi:hypothetical protein
LNRSFSRICLSRRHIIEDRFTFCDDRCIFYMAFTFCDDRCIFYMLNDIGCSCSFKLAGLYKQGLVGP